VIVERLLPGATPADLDACRGLQLTSFSKVDYDPSEELARPHARLWVAREDKGHPPAGFLLAWRLGGDLEILTVAVDPSQRWAGIGTALVGTATAEARALGCERVLLEVRASNAAALALYRRAGFIEDGLRRGYYSDPTEDAVLMSCPMKVGEAPGVGSTR
jgi:ribosomal-protein-alanine N-acetyltransferase